MIKKLKKIILYIACCIICLCSCVSETEKNYAVENNPITLPEYINFGFETSTGYKGVEQICVKKFEYEGHSYIWFRDSYGQASVGGAVHDPDCNKCKVD